MLAAFGMPGAIELLIIGILCLAMLGVPILIVAIVFWITRKDRRDG